jgi:hypothetical protein
MNTQVEDADAVFIGETENPEDVMNIMEADFSKRFGDDSVLTDDLYSVYFHDMQYDELYEVYPTDETLLNFPSDSFFHGWMEAKKYFKF